MKISYNWLKQYIDINTDPGQLAGILTGIGLEVGGIEVYETIRGGMKGIVIGEVKTKTKHPNADKLSLTTVDTGTGNFLQVVCGAPNVEAGQKVVVATIGTTLYKGAESFVIKESKIRGELSQGMICAEDEIGLGASHDGILVLPDDAPVGMQAGSYFKVESDTIFEIDITPNRADAASHVGIARDLAAFFKIPYHKPPVDGFKTDNKNGTVCIQVENTVACPRYSGVSISGLKISGSPGWLKNRLKSIGLNPVNNVVDITNYVLHETGQPLHAFDADKVSGKSVIIKTLEEGSKFVTLDGAEIKLSSQDLMICNSHQGMCIAGVYGGLDSGVSETTVNIFLESACFSPKSVRKTAKRLGLSTDASFRFERGTDPNITVYALKRAAVMIRDIAGGTISSDIIDIYPDPVKDFKVEIFYRNIDRLLGKSIDREIIKNILKHLEITIEKESDTGLTVLVPPYRVDVQREADVIEEVLRIYGYNNIEIPAEVRSSLSFSPKPDADKLMDHISEYLTGNGFHEIMCNSLTKSGYYENSGTFLKENLVMVQNPLSSDLDCLRQSLLFGGLEAVIYNINRKNGNLKLYESGNCYKLVRDDSGDILKKYDESKHLSIFLTGNKSERNWTKKDETVTFFQLKSHVINILAHLGFGEDNFQQSPAAGERYRDIFSGGMIYHAGNNEIFTIGSLNKKLLKTFDIAQEVFYADINWSALFEMIKTDRVKFSEIPKFPAVKRDLALLVDYNVPFEKIKMLAFKTGRKYLKQVSLFDVYEGESLGAGKKSYAVGFTLQDESRTLTDRQIEEIMNSLVKAFEKELDAKIR